MSVKAFDSAKGYSVNSIAVIHADGTIYENGERVATRQYVTDNASANTELSTSLTGNTLTITVGANTSNTDLSSIAGVVNTTSTVSASLTGNTLSIDVDGSVSNVDLSTFVDEGSANTSVSTAVRQANNTLTFTRADTSTFEVDLSNFGSVKLVNGISPNSNGEVSVALANVSTGNLANRPASGAEGDVYVVSGDSVSNNNGDTYIYSTGSSSWLEISPTDMASNDARYVNVSGDTMTGDLVLNTNLQVDGTSSIVGSATFSNTATFNSNSTFNSDVSVGDNKITDLADPTGAHDAVNYKFANNTYVDVAGDTMTGNLVIDSSLLMFKGSPVYSAAANNVIAWQVDSSSNFDSVDYSDYREVTIDSGAGNSWKSIWLTGVELRKNYNVEFDLTFENAPIVGSYNHFGWMINGQGGTGVNDQDRVVTRWHTNLGNRQIRYSRLAAAYNHTATPTTNIFDGTTRRVKIVQRDTYYRHFYDNTLEYTIASIASKTHDVGVFGFQFYEGNQIVKISNLKIETWDDDSDIYTYGQIKGLDDPTEADDAATKSYVDDATAFGSWTNVTTFTNGWTNYGSGFTVARYTKIGDVVHLQGLIRSGTINTTAFTLPTGYRPTGTILLSVLSNESGFDATLGSVGRLAIQSDGQVIPQVSGPSGRTDPNDWFTLNVSFLAV